MRKIDLIRSIRDRIITRKESADCLYLNKLVLKRQKAAFKVSLEFTQYKKKLPGFTLAVDMYLSKESSSRVSLGALRLSLTAWPAIKVDLSQTQDRHQCLCYWLSTVKSTSPLLILFWQQEKNPLKLHFGKVTSVW